MEYTAACVGISGGRIQDIYFLLDPEYPKRPARGVRQVDGTEKGWK